MSEREAGLNAAPRTTTQEPAGTRNLLAGLGTPVERTPVPGLQAEAAAFELDDVGVQYGDVTALKGVNLTIPRNRITAFIGPSGCGKSTLLRSLNRMNDLVDSARLLGEIRLEGEDIYAPGVDVVELRRRVGMVFQKPNPFPKTVYENVAYGLRIQGVRRASVLDEAVERSLTQAALWDEVKDRLDKPAVELSGGQQQRLVIARAIAIEPEVILLDEPCSALDPLSTAKVESLMYELKADFTLVIVTHNMQQASRVSDYTAFLYLGELVEMGPTDQIFLKPGEQATEDYITGRFG